MTHMTSSQYRKLQQESKGKLDRLAKRTGNKMNAKSQWYNGDFYHSTGEADYAKGLDLRLKAGDIKKWERQVKIDLRVNGRHIANYYIDFKITHVDGSIELVEYKGMVTDAFRKNWELLHALKDEMFPEGVTITMVKHKSKYKPKKTWRTQAKK